LAREKAEQQRLRAEAERVAQQEAEQERQERARAEAAERERQAEQERLAREKTDQQRLRAEAAERERRAKQERLARERAEQELKAEAERAEQQKAERERQERESMEAAERERQAEQEWLAHEHAEAERRTYEAAVAHRAAQQRAEQERLAREKAEQERLRAQADRVAQQRPADQEPPPNSPSAIGTPAPAPSEAWSSGWGAGKAVGAAPAKIAVPPPAVSMPGASDLIEQALKQLVPVRMLFNPPEEMQVGVTERVEARIGKGSTVELSTELKGRGLAQTERIQVGTFMKARLRGANFDVKLLSHEEQVVAESDFTQWAWDVTPLKAGSQVLSMLITVRIKLPDDGEEAKDYPVFDKQIKVRVNLQHTIAGLIRRYWQWLASAVIIPVLVWGYGSVTTYRHTQAAMREGDSYMATHAYEKALRAYQIGLNRDPENSVLQEKTKRARNALTALKNRIEALVNEGDSEYYKGAYGESKRKYQEALALDAENPALPEKIQRAQDAMAGTFKNQVSDLIKQGDSYYASGAYDNAIDEYQKGLELDPENSALKEKLRQARLEKQLGDLINRGDSHYASGAYDEAIDEYQKGFTLDPNNSVLKGRIQRVRKKQIDTLTRQGDSDREHSHYDEAIAKYRKALALDPNNQVLAKRITQATNAEEWEKEHGTLKPGALTAHPKN
jgi:tetratricopeptide (TPR) repeat protein